MLKPTKILVPTDFTEYSDAALKQGLDIAKQYGAKVFLLHVAEELHDVIIDYPVPEKEIAAEELRETQDARAEMRKQLDKFPRSKEVEVVMEIRKGEPSEEIIKEEKEKGIDLIVIASLGRTALAKFFIGGVARKVLMEAAAPVLLTK